MYLNDRSKNLDRVSSHSLVDPAPSRSSLGRNVSLSSMTSVQQDNTHIGADNIILGTEPTVMFFACKKETFQLRKNYKRFHRLLKSHLTCTIIALDKDLSDGLLPFCNLVILAGINEPLNDNELGLLFEYVQNGGSVLVLAESTTNTRLYNDFTRHFGIVLLENVVISVIRKKQYHPKECFISSAVICPSLFPSCNEPEDEENLDIIYPYGCTLTVQNTMATTIISSGPTSFPCNHPLGAIYYHAESKGRVVVLGSGHAFTDEFIQLEDNQKLLEILLDVLVAEDTLDLVVRDGELMDQENLYCTDKKAGRFRGVMQDIDEYVFPGAMNPIMRGGQVSNKPMKMMSSGISRLDYSLLNDVFNAYDHLQIERVPLTQTVKPQLEASLFQPKLAIFPPGFRNIAPPPLELFDLDEEFSAIETRLGRLCNKCKEDDVEFFIESMGNLLNVSIPSDSEHRATSILFQMLQDLANFKKPAGDPDSETDSLSRTSDVSMIDGKYFDNSSEEEKQAGDSDYGDSNQKS